MRYVQYDTYYLHLIILQTILKDLEFAGGAKSTLREFLLSNLFEISEFYQWNNDYKNRHP